MDGKGHITLCDLFVWEWWYHWSCILDMWRLGVQILRPKCKVQEAWRPCSCTKEETRRTEACCPLLDQPARPSPRSSGPFCLILCISVCCLLPLQCCPTLFPLCLYIVVVRMYYVEPSLELEPPILLTILFLILYSSV